MLLSDVPVLGAHHAPDVHAIIFGERRMTYVELRDRCWRLSNALAGTAAPGDRAKLLSVDGRCYVECCDGSVLQLIKVASVDGPLNLRGLAAALDPRPPEPCTIRGGIRPRSSDQADRILRRRDPHGACAPGRDQSQSRDQRLGRMHSHPSR